MPEAAAQGRGEESVVLDIGAGRGAAVLFTPSSLAGRELEIRPAGAPWSGTHTGVRRRDLRDGSCFAAVFGSLAAGGYQVRVRGTDSGPTIDLVVPTGAIVECNWPDDGAAPG